MKSPGKSHTRPFLRHLAMGRVVLEDCQMGPGVQPELVEGWENGMGIHRDS